MRVECEIWGVGCAKKKQRKKGSLGEQKLANREMSLF